MTDLDDARRRIQKRINAGVADDMIEGLIEAAMSVEKKVSHEFACRKCGQLQRQQVAIQDPITSAKVLELLLNQGSGRPSEERPETEPVVVHRTIVYSTPDPDLVPATAAAGTEDDGS